MRQRTSTSPRRFHLFGKRVCIRVFLLVVLAGLFGSGLFSFSMAQAEIDFTAPRVYLSMDLLFRGGEVTDGPALHALLAELGAVPDDDRATVVRLRSIDSGWFEVEYEGERERWTAIVDAATELGAPPPILVVGPRSTEASRRQRGSFFPATPEELEVAGFDWLVNPAGFDIRWDPEGRSAAQIAQRWLIFGVEEIGGLDMTLCVDQGEIRGWARAFYLNQPGPASVGKFVEDCTNGNLELYTDFSIPQDLLVEYGLAGGPFALVLPWFGYERVVDAVRLGERTLAGSRAGIPMRVVATDTIADERGWRFVLADEHAGLLVERGVEVDEALSSALPDWVGSYASRRASLLLFDDQGELIGSFFVLGGAGANDETLSQALLRLGLL